jgi:adenylate cyclase class 2
LEQREIEIKLKMDASRTRIAARLRSMGATLYRARHFEDNQILDYPSGKLHRSGSLLRIRRIGRGATLTYKGPRHIVRGAKSRVEMETEVSEGATLLKVLERIGLRQVFRYQKHRTVYRCESVLIALDETPVGNYIEVEGSPAGIVRIARRLGFRREDFDSRSYYELFVAYRRVHRFPSKDMILGITTSERA